MSCQYDRQQGRVMGRELWTSPGYSKLRSCPNMVSGVSIRKYRYHSSKLQSDIPFHKRIHIYGQFIFYSISFASDMRRNIDLLCMNYSPWRIRIWLTKGLPWGVWGRKWAGFVSLSMPFNQHSGANYLRSKSYLGVEISSDIVTEHWCQVCALSTMSLLFRLPAVCWHGKWLRNQKTWAPRGLNSLRQAEMTFISIPIIANQNS